MEDNMRNLVAGFIRDAEKSADAGKEPGDYIGENGLLYCGKCRTPKQVRIKFRDGVQKIFKGKTEGVFQCCCKCTLENIRKQKERMDFEEKLLRIRRLNDCGYFFRIWAGKAIVIG